MLQTVDADAKMEAECLPVCGSLSCFAAAADVEMVLAAVSAAMTAACGSSSCFAAAAVSEITAVDADPYVITDFNKLRLGRVKHPPKPQPFIFFCALQ